MSLTEKILEKVDILDIIGRYVNLKRVGKNYVGLCPFHKEKTPSFTVAPDKQIFKCFGCGIGGNVIKFIMEYEKVDFPDAIKILAQEAGIDLSKYKNKSSKEEKIDNKEKLLKINQIALKFFIEKLKSNKTAYDYLKNTRNLNDQIIQTFQLGYAPDSYYELIDFLKSKGFSNEELIKLSLAKKGQNDIYSFFRNRIIFPIYDHIGNLVAFAGRAINPEDNPKYLNTSETPLYDKSKILYGLNIAKNYIKEYGKIIIVEGYMDVIALYRARMPVGVATCGTALSIKHLKLLKRYTENIIFSFDNDEAGIQATIRGLKLAFENKIYPKSLTLPNNFKDLDELINFCEKENKDINDYLDYKDSFEYILEYLINTYNPVSLEGKRKILNTSFDILSYIFKTQDFSSLDFYLEILSNKIGQNFDTIKKQFLGFLKNEKKINKFEELETKSDKQLFTLEEKIAAILFNDFFSEYDNGKLSKALENLIGIIEYLPENNILKKTIFLTLSEEEKEKLKEIQLILETKLEKNKAEFILLKEIKSLSSQLVRSILKTLNPEKKQNLIKFDMEIKRL